MFGAFRPSAPLSGGLLWKIPWRISAPQKLRQRRRLRRVDNVVAVLDTALQRHALSSSPQPTPSTSSADSSSPPSDPSTRLDNKTPTSSIATREELLVTAQGQRFLQSEASAGQSRQRATREEAAEAQRTGTIKLIERWKAEMPTEAEMLPRDKYTMFDRKEKKYRKGVHSK
ncbi:hypothetical protein LTR28_012990 [Elasticomyces elasticus]|nr:hypothetical protein LTR28_012990 [Elasticomyces elasticus]